MVAITTLGSYAVSGFDEAGVMQKPTDDLKIERAVVLRWTSTAGRRYQVEKFSADGSRWSAVSDVITGRGTGEQWVVPGGQREEMFRVVELD